MRCVSCVVPKNLFGRHHVVGRNLPGCRGRNRAELRSVAHFAATADNPGFFAIAAPDNFLDRRSLPTFKPVLRLGKGTHAWLPGSREGDERRVRPGTGRNDHELPTRPCAVGHRVRTRLKRCCRCAISRLPSPCRTHRGTGHPHRATPTHPSLPAGRSFHGRRAAKANRRHPATDDFAATRSTRRARSLNAPACQATSASHRPPSTATCRRLRPTRVRKGR